MPAYANSIFDYSCPREFLKSVLAEKKKKNARFSVRAWSKQLGYRSPSLLLNVLSGDRVINPELAGKFAVLLEMTREQKAYFEALILSATARMETEKAVYRELRNRLVPDKDRRNLEPDKFRLISEWYCLTLLQMFALNGFRTDENYLSRRLRSKVSPENLRSAWNRLVRLGLIKTDSSGKANRSTGNLVVKGGVPSQTVRRHHRQMMALACSALEEQSVDERDFKVTRLAIRKEDYGKALDIIRSCHQALQKLSAPESADEIYALNTQFFQLTGGVA